MSVWRNSDEEYLCTCIIFIAIPGFILEFSFSPFPHSQILHHPPPAPSMIFSCICNFRWGILFTIYLLLMDVQATLPSVLYILHIYLFSVGRLFCQNKNFYLRIYWRATRWWQRNNFMDGACFWGIHQSREVAQVWNWNFCLHDNNNNWEKKAKVQKVFQSMHNPRRKPYKAFFHYKLWGCLYSHPFISTSL